MAMGKSPTYSDQNAFWEGTMKAVSDRAAQNAMRRTQESQFAQTLAFQQQKQEQDISERRRAETMGAIGSLAKIPLSIEMYNMMRGKDSLILGGIKKITPDSWWGDKTAIPPQDLNAPVYGDQFIRGYQPVEGTVPTLAVEAEYGGTNRIYGGEVTPTGQLMKFPVDNALYFGLQTPTSAEGGM